MGGGIAPASDSLSVFRRGNPAVADGSLKVVGGDGVDEEPVFVATADLLAHGAVVPVSKFGTPVGLFAHGAVVPTLLLGALLVLFAQGAAVPTPGFGMPVGLFAHEAFVPS